MKTAHGRNPRKTLLLSSKVGGDAALGQETRRHCEECSDEAILNRDC